MATILVVDDEAEIRDLIKRVLLREGHQVDTANNGAAALEAVQSRSYDLVISNVRMPVMDGPTFYARVQEVDRRLASRFIFCTGDIMSLAVRTFLLSANQPVLAKPFSIGSLRDLVRWVLEGAPSFHCTVTRQLEERFAASAFPA